MRNANIQLLYLLKITLSLIRFKIFIAYRFDKIRKKEAESNIDYM